MPSCCTNKTCENDQKLEYQKCHKPENNSGCNCGCGDTTSSSSLVNEKRVVTNKKSRVDFI